MKLNKWDIANTMTEIGKIPHSTAEKQLDLALIAIIKTLAKVKEAEPNKKGIRGSLTIVGFGRFEVKANPARLHRNPQNQTVKVPKDAHNKIKFKEGKFFDEEVN